MITGSRPEMADPEDFERVGAAEEWISDHGLWQMARQRQDQKARIPAPKSLYRLSGHTASVSSRIVGPTCWCRRQTKIPAYDFAFL